MKIIVPNLHRRPDKRKAMEENFAKYSVPMENVEFVNSHDAENYANLACLLDAMRCSGWDIRINEALHVLKDDGRLLGIKDKNKIPIRAMPHMAFRWTYLDILRDIVFDNKEALILIDDMCLPYPGYEYERQIDICKQLGGNILGFDPIEESDADSPQFGYDCPTEEAVFYTPAGARSVIPYILDNPILVIGDVIRLHYPTNRVYTTPKLMAVSIGKKSDWGSDIHVNSDSLFR